MQVPIAVAENKVGNKSAFARKTKLKQLEMPDLLRSMKRGIQKVNECSNKMAAPPIKVSARLI